MSSWRQRAQCTTHRAAPPLQPPVGIVRDGLDLVGREGHAPHRDARLGAPDELLHQAQEEDEGLLDLVEVRDEARHSGVSWGGEGEAGEGGEREAEGVEGEGGCLLWTMDGRGGLRRHTHDGKINGAPRGRVRSAATACHPPATC
jgi:hypothetical protein